MSMTAWQRVDRFGRNLAPCALTVALLLASASPAPIPGAAPLAPALVLAAVYYWTIHRPDLLRPGALFFIGVLQDLVTGGAVGVSSLILVALHWLLLTQRRIFLAGTFIFMWFGFALTVFTAIGAQWLIYTIANVTVMPVQAPLFQAILTLALFPPLAWGFMQVHRTFLSN
jgi:rod shape-determining protein MreD